MDRRLEPLTLRQSQLVGRSASARGRAHRRGHGEIGAMKTMGEIGVTNDGSGWDLAGLEQVEATVVVMKTAPLKLGRGVAINSL
jgi:hypothetical protein